MSRKSREGTDRFSCEGEAIYDGLDPNNLPFSQKRFWDNHPYLALSLMLAVVTGIIVYRIFF